MTIFDMLKAHEETERAMARVSACATGAGITADEITRAYAVLSQCPASEGGFLLPEHVTIDESGPFRRFFVWLRLATPKTRTVNTLDHLLSLSGRA